jgi:hypothetical protein
MKKPLPPPVSIVSKQSPRAKIPKIVPITMDVNTKPLAHRVFLYGTTGIGKTTLAANLPAPYFLDVEESTRFLEGTVYDKELRAAPTWELLRGKLAAIANDPPQGVRSVVIDSATVAQELAKEHVIANRKTDKGHTVDSIEGFGWGKGWQFVSDEYNGLLADLDRVIAKEINVCLVAHEVDTPVPNPAGEDWIRWEPDLFAGDKKGRGSIRGRLKGWSDHLLFVGYDVRVDEGKGLGSGTRTIFTMELPTHVAKSRALQGSFDFRMEDPGAVWRELGITV